MAGRLAVELQRTPRLGPTVAALEAVFGTPSGHGGSSLSALLPTRHRGVTPCCATCARVPGPTHGRDARGAARGSRRVTSSDALGYYLAPEQLPEKFPEGSAEAHVRHLNNRDDSLG